MIAQLLEEDSELITEISWVVAKKSLNVLD